VSSISPSALDPAVAYVSVDDQRQDDFHPLVFRTRDYGASWTPIDTGLPAEQPVSVVRADPVRAGLLYAGTTDGVFVSFDDGGHWQSLKLNLPNAWVKDLLVHDGDLIAATQGRAIWVLDDLAPLRQLSPAVLTAPAHLFAPAPAWRVHPNNNRDTPLPPGTPQGQNPPAGAIIDYWLGPHSRGPVSLAIYDFQGHRVRRFESDATAQPIRAHRYFAKAWLRPPERLAAGPGMHRFVWNLRYPRPQAISYRYSMQAVPGLDTPTSIEGPFVLPGIYTVVLSAGAQQYRASLVVRLDPREHATLDALRALLAYSQKIDGALGRVQALYAAEESLHGALVALQARMATGRAPHRLDARVGRLLARTAGAGRSDLLTLNQQLSALEADAESADRAPTAADGTVLEASLQRLAALAGRWHATLSRIGGLNRRLHRAGLATVRVP
jgi:hypothetical protein